MSRKHKKNKDNNIVTDAEKNEIKKVESAENNSDTLNATDNSEETKTEEASVEETKTEETKIEEAKTEAVSTEETKTEEAKTEEAKTEAVSTEETKTEETKTEAVSTEETKTEEVKPEEVKTDTANSEKKKITPGFAVMLAFVVVFVLAGASVLFLYVTGGWKNAEGGYKYYEWGSLKTGYTVIEDKEYYFAEDKIMHEGWITIEGKVYYQDIATGIYKNESQINNESYNLRADGQLVTGPEETKEGTYVYDDHGYGVQGLTSVDGNIYYAGEDGLLQDGWHEIEFKKYYFNTETGIMTTGIADVEGVTYYFDENGVMKNGLISFEDGKRLFETDGGLVTGLHDYLGKTMYFGDDGLMQTGFITIGEKEYYFADTDGSMFKGWMLLGDNYCYYDVDGSKVYGWFTMEDGKHYFEEENGYMLKGWQELEGLNRYFDDAGVMAVGVKTVDNALYYFDANGDKLGGEGWYYGGGHRYYRVNDGQLTTGFKDIAGETYYFTSSGEMVHGITSIGSNQYYFDGDGKLLRNTKVGKFVIDENGIMTNPYAVITLENLDSYIEVLLDTYGRDMQSIFKYCRNNFSYKYREKLDVNSMACRMLNNGNGACWDYAALCYKMLTAAGYNCRIVVGRGAVFSEHNWIIIETSPGVWRHMDPERTKMWVYLKTDAELEALDGIARGVRYQWDHSLYPAAN